MSDILGRLHGEMGSEFNGVHMHKDFAIGRCKTIEDAIEEIEELRGENKGLLESIHSLQRPVSLDGEVGHFGASE